MLQSARSSFKQYHYILTAADLCKKAYPIYTQPNCTFELTMSKLCNIVIMKKFIIKQGRPRILLSLEKLDLKISYKAIIQSDDYKTQTYIHIT